MSLATSAFGTKQTLSGWRQGSVSDPLSDISRARGKTIARPDSSEHPGVVDGQQTQRLLHFKITLQQSQPICVARTG